MKYLVLFTSILLVLTMACSFLPTENDMKIYEDTVRLHVLANSDSEHDQAVKLTVRDAVLQYIRRAMDGAATKAEAKNIVEANLDGIRKVAEDTLVNLGENLPVTVMFTKEKYPERTYDTLHMPSGIYDSLRILIGSGEGHNWWCVLYPSLCTDVSKTASAFIRTGFGREQVELLTGGEKPKYKIKFKLLEIFSECFA